MFEGVVVGSKYLEEENLVLVGFSTGEVVIWNYSEGTIVSGLKAYTKDMTDLQYNPKTNTLATCSGSGEVKLFQIKCK